MALRQTQGSGFCGRAVGDPACARCVQGHAGEVGPQRRARYCSVDAARLVSPGSLQITAGTGSAGFVDSTQAGAEQAPGHREQPAGDIAGFRAEGRKDDGGQVCRAHPRAGGGASDAGEDRQDVAVGAPSSAAGVQ